VLARVINRLLADYPSLTFAFFFGLILSSSILISKGVKVNIGTILSFLVGSSFAIFFVGMRGITTDHSLVTLFFSGMITVCAMILPGISGAFIMLFLGQYKYMIHALNYFYVADIGTYLLGGAIGILAFSRFLSYLISKHRAITLSFLMGLMLGALRQPIQEIIAQPQNVYSTLLSGVIGFLVVLSFHVANLKKRKGNVNPCKR
jgi:putative membrane protein